MRDAACTYLVTSLYPPSGYGVAPMHAPALTPRPSGGPLGLATVGEIFPHRQERRTAPEIFHPRGD